MKTQTNDTVRNTLGRTLIVGLGLISVQGVLGQTTTTNEPTTMAPVVITGSLIPTAETVTASPVDIISAAQIENTGAGDVLQVLKKLNPSFSGNLNLGAEVNNGGFGESYVALRNLQTLVLLNGRRLGNSSFSSTQFTDGSQFADLNTIPVAAIERIEVLKDGASALYGSEAIGGVVNIITKRDFTGVELGGRYGFATGPGDFDEVRATLVAGTGNERSSFLAAAQYYQRDPLLTTDREQASYGYDQLVARNINPDAVSYISPSFAGKVQEGGTGASYLLNPYYLQAGRQGPPVLPGRTFGGPSAVTDYNAAVVGAGMPQPYLPAGGGAANRLNTTLFGTHTIQSQDRRNFFGSGSHELFGKRMEIYGDFLYANIESEGVLAPSPVVGLASKQANIDIPANNPYNPFGIALGPTAGSPGLPPGGPRIRSRFVDSGNRLFDSQTDYYHFVGGLKGKLDRDWGYDAAYTYNRYDQVQYTRNAVNGAALDQALRPNGQTDPVTGRPLSQLAGTGPLNVPVYNIFAGGKDANGLNVAGVNDPATIDAIRTTLFQTGVSEQWDVGGAITGSLFDLPGGRVGVAFGGGFSSESLSIDYDGLTKIGKVPGLNASSPTEGTRDSWAGFVEVFIPIMSPDMDIPGFRSLEITAAGRYETFEPGGDSAVPKVGLRWQPLDEQITLRGTYSQSFVAPTPYQLFGGAAVNVPVIITPAVTGDPTSLGVFQEYTSLPSNRELQPAEAENWGAGVVFSPKFAKGLTLSADYYHISTENDVFRVSSQAMVNDLNANGSNSRWVNQFSRADGSRLTTPAPFQASDADWGQLVVPILNGAQRETDGLELAATYNLPTETAGTFDFFASANLLFSFEYQDPVSGGPFSYEGQYTDGNLGIAGAQGTLPDYIITCGVNWEIPVGHDAFAVNLTAQYIPEVDSLGSLHPSNLAFERTFDDGLNDYTMDGNTWKVDAWYRLDAQISYEWGKNKANLSWYDGTRVAFGINNLTETTPPLIAASFEDNTDKSTYDIVGRFFYMSLSKKF